MTTPKNVIRRFPPFAAFQKFLVSETSVGNISRQEVVSMIPPLVMDLQPGMTVLDMCAAPGSKAAQLLEMVHNGEEARVRKSLKDHAKDDGRYASPDVEPVDAADLEVDFGDNGRATGLLIANDSDYKRSHMLIHKPSSQQISEVRSNLGRCSLLRRWYYQKECQFMARLESWQRTRTIHHTSQNSCSSFTNA